MANREYWMTYRKPCKMSDNLYYVGTECGPSHLLKTTDGLVLIDTGYPQTLYLLIENIRAIGEDPYNIKHIVHSHGHYDHIGGTRALVELTGAKTYIGRGDEDMVRGINGLDWAEDIGYRFDECFEPDVIVEDGDVIKFGDTEMRFVSTPGHTDGTFSIFFNTTYNGTTYLAGMFGGAGLNTMSREAMAKYGISEGVRDTFLKSIDKVIDEPVELHIGNHLSNNNHRDKEARMTDTYNPFINERTYKPFLQKTKENAINYFEKN